MVDNWEELKKMFLRNDDTLYQMLDAGIKDMESGRELLLEEAFDKISELRAQRRELR